MRQGLWDAIGPVRERGFPVKWVRPDGVHLTLKFLGDVDDAREPELRAALTEAAGRGEPRGVTIHVEGFGVFPDVKRPRVVWAGVTPDPALELLQHRVEQVFAPLGFPTEARPFRPHVTLGRGDCRGVESSLAAIAFTATTIITDLDLMQSTPQSGGAVYQVKHRGRLS